MAQRTPGGERIGQCTFPGQPGQDWQESEEGAEEDHLAGGDGLGGLEHSGHDHEGTD